MYERICQVIKEHTTIKEEEEEQVIEYLKQ
jgi:DNA-directed RNA polymerase subunit H (RpoH/RPB5)